MTRSISCPAAVSEDPVIKYNKKRFITPVYLKKLSKISLLRLVKSTKPPFINLTPGGDLCMHFF
jgi:hypothetical protein